MGQRDAESLLQSPFNNRGISPHQGHLRKFMRANDINIHRGQTYTHTQHVLL